MNNTSNETLQTAHATKLIEDFLSGLDINRFEGPQSNSGYREYSDNMYYTKDTHKYSIRYMFGEWVLQTEDMYGWDWRITVDIMTSVNTVSLILRRVDCLGNATDILVVDSAKLEAMDNLDEVVTMLLSQGAHTDHLSDLNDRGFSSTILPDTTDNESPWDVFYKTSEQRLAVAGITVTNVDNSYIVPSKGITKSFSTDGGDVNKFWLSTAVDQTYLTIWGMGFSFTVAKQIPITLDVIDESFKYFFAVINSDLLSATTNGRFMAKVYQNKLIVLGGLKETVGHIDNEKEITTLFKHVIKRMETIAISKPDKIRFNRNRVGDITGIYYYPVAVGVSKPLRIWLSNKKIQHTPMNSQYIGTACLEIEPSDPSSRGFALLQDDLKDTTGVVGILETMRSNFARSNSNVDSSLVDEILNHQVIH